MSNIGIIILATARYFPLGLRLMHRINHFYKGESKIQFHFFSDTNPNDYTTLKNITYHETIAMGWNETMLLKLRVVETVAKSQDYDYFVYIDADSNVNKNFEDKDFVSENFILKHFLSDVKNHYEQNKLSSAYIDPTQYPKFYYHACYFGGNKSSVLQITKTSIDLFEQDIKKGITAYAEDESYINKYFYMNPPKTIFDINSDSFPFVGDKGIVFNDWGKFIKVLFTEQEYQKMLNKIISLKDKDVLWDIKESKVV
jgi:hypothetical protein